jgi:hypothetical protein
VEATEVLFEQIKGSSILNSFLENASRIGLELMQIELNKTCKLYNFVLNYVQYLNDVNSNLNDN